MMDSEVLTPNGMERVSLLPGELCVAEEPVLMATLLGSCVAVCVYNRSTGMAGMNHYLRDCRQESKDSYGKYGDTSTTYLIKRIMEKDKTPGHCEAKIFGGCGFKGNVGFGANIGADNIVIARSVLKGFNIPIIEEDVGGEQGRRIYFNTKDFTVQVRAISLKRKDTAKRKVRVLIVDDSLLVRKILRKDIESSPDFEVCEEASNAYEARDKLLETDPDVVSLDIMMPGMDGLDFLKKIMRYRPMPVVIVSTLAKTGSEIEQRAKKLGATGVIDKEELELTQGAQGARLKYLAALKAAAESIVKES